MKSKTPLSVHVPKPSWAWAGYLILLLALLLTLAVGRMALFGQLEQSTQVWAELTLLLLIAVVAEGLMQQWKQPVVIILLLLGMLVSPHTLALAWPTISSTLQPIVSLFGLTLSPQQLPHLVENNDLLQVFAQLGAILLLLRAGLHSKLSAVFNLSNLIVALGGVTLPFILGYLFSIWSGGTPVYALFMGAALTATSVGITAAVLAERGELDKPFAQMILGAAVIDDILALVVLGLVRATPSGLAPAAVTPLLGILALSAAFILCGLVAGLWVINRFFKDEAESSWMRDSAKTSDDSTERAISRRALAGLLAIVFFYSFAAQALGLSAIIGAFLAGLVIAQSGWGPRLAHALFPLEVLFIPIFFIALGMLVDVSTLPALFWPLFALVAIAIIGKVVGCGLTAKWLGADFKSALTVGVGMIPRGEMALIIALVGLNTLGADGLPLLPAAQYTLIAAMAFFTTLLTPPLLQWVQSRRAGRA